MVKLGNFCDVPAMINLWLRCFDDSAEYVENFLRERFSPGRAVLFWENGQLVSMLFLFDGTMKISGEAFPSMYVYAACTHPDFRRKGLMSKLLETAENLARGNGCGFLAIRPANAHLFDYYGNFGFQTAFELKQIAFSRAELESLAAESASAFVAGSDELCAMRDSAFRGNDYFAWDSRALAYAFEETRFCGGDFVVAGTHHAEACALYFFENDIARVKEFFTVVPSGFPSVARLLLDRCECTKFVFCVPADSGISAPTGTLTRMKNAMLKPLDEHATGTLRNIRSAYMGLALDE